MASISANRTPLSHLLGATLIGLMLVLQSGAQEESSLLLTYSKIYDHKVNLTANDSSYRMAVSVGHEIAGEHEIKFNRNSLMNPMEVLFSYPEFQIIKEKMAKPHESIWDANAIIRILTNRTDLELEDLRDVNNAKEALESYIVPPCKDLVQYWDEHILDEEHFGRALVGSQAQLREDFDNYGNQPIVKNFLKGWIDYHVCKSLVVNDQRSKLIRRISIRADDTIRVNAKLLAKKLLAEAGKTKQ